MYILCYHVVAPKVKISSSFIFVELVVRNYIMYENVRKQIKIEKTGYV